MSEAANVKFATLITSIVNNSTSSPYPMQRGPATFQVTVAAVGTGTSVFNGIATVNASNDNIAYVPIGTVTALGTLAAAGASSGTASGLLALTTLFPFKDTKVINITTATGAGVTFTSTITMGL